METIEHKEPGTYYVDLDGTLAHYTGWKSPEDIGDPIPAMMDRVKAWLMEGQPVKIFTARFPEHHGFVREWLFRNGLGGIPVTNVKGIDGIEFWDDRAVPVEPNTGRNLIEALQSMRQGREEDMEVVKQYMEDAGQFRATIEKLRRDNKSLSEDAHRESEELRDQIATLEEGRTAHMKHLVEAEAESDRLAKVNGELCDEIQQLRIEVADRDFYHREFAAVSKERDAANERADQAESELSDRAEIDRQIRELIWLGEPGSILGAVRQLWSNFTKAKARIKELEAYHIGDYADIRAKLEAVSAERDQIQEQARRYKKDYHAALGETQALRAELAALRQPTAGVPSVEELADIGFQAHATQGGTISTALRCYKPAFREAWEATATAIRNAVITGMGGENGPVYGGWHLEDGYKIVPNGEPSGNTGQLPEPVSDTYKLPAPTDAQVEELARVLFSAWAVKIDGYPDYDTIDSESKRAYAAEARAAFAHIGAVPVGWDLDVTAGEVIATSKDAHDKCCMTEDGVNRSDWEVACAIIDLCRARIRPTFECPTCAKSNIHTLGKIGIDWNPESEVVNG